MRHLFALALALSTSAMPLAASEMREIFGEVMLLERMALPDDTVFMLDITDARDQSVASSRRQTTGTQSPFAFQVEAPADALLVLRAGLRMGDDSIWLSEPVGIEPDSEPLDLGTIRALRTPRMGFASLLSCGNTLIEIGFLPDEVRLRLNEQVITMQTEPAASGAHFVAADNPSSSIHLKETSAIVRIDGAELSECTLTRPEADLTQGVWNISAINDKPTQFPSRTELVFYPDGRMSATVGCNRMIGGFRRHGGMLSIGRVASTMMACPEGLDTQERNFAQALERVDGYRLDTDAGRLTLMAGGKAVIQARK